MAGRIPSASTATRQNQRTGSPRGRWSGSWRCHVRCKYSPGEHSTAAFPASALWRTDMFPRLRWYALYVMWKQRTYGTCCLAADELVTSGSASTFWTPLKQPGRQTARERRSLKNCSALTTPAAGPHSTVGGSLFWWPPGTEVYFLNMATCWC